MGFLAFDFCDNDWLFFVSIHLWEALHPMCISFRFGKENQRHKISFKLDQKLQRAHPFVGASL